MTKSRAVVCALVDGAAQRGDVCYRQLATVLEGIALKGARYSKVQKCVQKAAKVQDTRVFAMGEATFNAMSKAAEDSEATATPKQQQPDATHQDIT